jgi:hypothetical protein
VPPELLAHANEGSHCDESGTARPYRRGNEAKALVNLLCRYPVGSARLPSVDVVKGVSTIPQAFFADPIPFSASVLRRYSHFVGRRFLQFSPQRIYVPNLKGPRVFHDLDELPGSSAGPQLAIDALALPLDQFVEGIVRLDSQF